MERVVYKCSKFGGVKKWEGVTGSIRIVENPFGWGADPYREDEGRLVFFIVDPQFAGKDGIPLNGGFYTYEARVQPLATKPKWRV